MDFFLRLSDPNAFPYREKNLRTGQNDFCFVFKNGGPLHGA